MVTAVAAILIALGAGTGGGDPAERKAVAFLAAEVPRWSRENHCFSCHNNGDAARALFSAKAAGIAVDPNVLADTLAWLTRPDGWERQGPDGPISDKRLARIEFSLALAAAVDAKVTDRRDALDVVARRLAADQAEDGSWPIDDQGLGSPATYGRSLATALSARVLQQADPRRYAAAIARARGWVGSLKVASVLDAASVLYLEPADGKVAPSEPATLALEFLRRSQGKSGGWGPYPDRPPEPFDTAVALLVLSSGHRAPQLAEARARGRSALIAMQNPDGSWPETTRPAGGESYAQRISTTGWATLALVASRP